MNQDLKFPNAEDYPDGYNWFAYDQNGLGYFYKEKPVKGCIAWGVDAGVTNMEQSAIFSTYELVENWQETLRSKAHHQPTVHYYKWHPVCEAIKISEQFPSNLGQAIQYIWRANIEKVTKGQTREQIIQDLEKAVDVLKFEIERISQ